MSHPDPDNSRSRPLVSIVVATFNRADLLRACLSAIRNQDYPSIEVIVVDNGSSEDIAGFLKAEFPETICVRLPRNSGFAGGNNAGIARAGGEFIALLNNDAVPDRGWISALVDAAGQDDNIGAVASVVIDGHNPRVLDSFGVRVALDGMSRQALKGMPVEHACDSAETAAVSGCACIFRSSALQEVGTFDDAFFAYCEDTDLCLRLVRAGWRIVTEPRARAVHFYSQTSGPYSARKIFWVERNHFWVAAKNFPWPLLMLVPFVTFWRFAVQLYALLAGRGGMNNFVSGAGLGAVVAAVFRAQIGAIMGFPRAWRMRRLSVETLSDDGGRRLLRLLWTMHCPIHEIIMGPSPGGGQHPSVPTDELPKGTAWKLRLLWSLTVLVYLALLALAAGPSTVYTGDETRFIETSAVFARGLTVDLLKHYNEMSSPLPFVLFGAWGRFMGFDLAAMRLGALSVAFVTLLLIFEVFLRILKSRSSIFLASLCLLANPYTAMTGIFVFTDMPTLFFAMMVLLGVSRNSPFLAFVGMAGSMLCRQYLVFLTVAAAVSAVFQMLDGRLRSGLRLLLASVMATVPVSLLFILWGGLCPDNSFRSLYLGHGVAYSPDGLVLYVSLLGAYSLPVWIIRRKVITPGTPFVLFSLGLAALLYFLFPVRPSESAVAAGFSAVGILDQSLRSLSAAPAVRHIFFAGGLSLGIMLLCQLLRCTRRTLAAPDAFFMDLCIYSFLLIMPFSYLHWEKYFLPLLPFVLCRMLMFPVSVSPRPRAHTHDDSHSANSQ